MTGYEGSPSEISVTLLDSTGQELVSQTFFPSYRETSPNGVSCGPTCRVAQVELAIP